MKLDNKEILKEFLKLKRGEVKWFFKYVFLKMLIGFLVGVFSVGLYMWLASYVSSLLGIYEGYGVLLSLLFLLIMLFICPWFVKNWKQAKVNLYIKIK